MHGRCRHTLRTTIAIGVVLSATLGTTACSGNKEVEPPAESAVASSAIRASATDISLRSPDGGADFYGRFIDGLPTSPDFFPIGVWSESVVDDTGWPRDKAAGLNLYVDPTGDTNLDTVSKAGMFALPKWFATDTSVVGYTGPDEVDMWAGPGESKWTGRYPGEGDICDPPDSRCGYSVMDQFTTSAPRGRMLYTNFGKGILFWETGDEARRFVNHSQNVVSADAYWFTDPSICIPSEGGRLLGSTETVPEGRCRLAANYGTTVARVRSLVEPAGSKPVWNFVEVGQPFEGGDHAITAQQIRAAVWSGLINGARGIVYFNHSFGGSCQTQHVLRDCDPAITAAVASANAQITKLAPVLNSPFVNNYVRSTETVDAAAKLSNGEFYVLAGSKQNAGQDAEFSLSCGNAKSAIVVDEGREIPIINGTFTDHFADGNAVHIYRISGGDTCGLG